MEMNDREIYIEQLMMEKLSGIIGDEDSHHLDELIHSDISVRSKWEKLNQTFKELGSQKFIDSLDISSAVTRLRGKIGHRPETVRTTSNWLKIAASILIPVALAGLFLSQRTEQHSVATAATPNAEKKIKLYSGNSVVSFTQSGTVTSPANLKNARLNIGNGSLSYVPLANANDKDLNTLEIPVTMNYKLTLSDGTDVWLNSDSKLKFPFTFSGEKREVWISGEAYFKVTRNPKRPFIVHTPLYDIQVFGTEFNVNTYDSLHESTALVTGSVNAHTANGPGIMLKPGYEAVFSSAKTFQLSSFDVNSKLSWMQGVFYFDNAPLTDIAAVIRRWYGVTMIFDNSSLSESHFTGALRKDRQLNEFLDNLSITSRINYKITNGVVHLRDL